MGKLKYIHGTMFSGKTAQLINAYEIYRRKHLEPIVIKPIIDDREGTQKGWGETSSRLMLDKKVPAYYYQNLQEELPTLKYGSIIVDEAQFMSEEDVRYLTKVMDEKDITVLAYGLKTDSNGHLFEGSKALLAFADEITEMESLCQNPNCTNKAQMHLRYIDGQIDKGTDSVAIEKGNVTYRSVCRPCWSKEKSR